MTHSADILVVGAGPGGIAAATAAAAGSGQRVVLLDDNSAPGGQIWRESAPSMHAAPSPQRSRAIAALQASGVEWLAGHRVVDSPGDHRLETIVETDGTPQMHEFEWRKLILATGARERFLPFPGWTLPGVFGAGGLQALVQAGFWVAGQRVVVAGSGPLLLAVAAHLRQAGATIVSVNEQASLGQLLPFAATLAAHPARISQGVGYRAALGLTPYRTGCWPVSAEGTNRLTSVRLTDGIRVWSEQCDLLACGFHLVPNTELAALLGCEIDSGFVTTDSCQQTSVPEIYCVGEPTGIAGLKSAVTQGEIAGLAATDRLVPARLVRARTRNERFGRALAAAFRLRSEVAKLCQPETIVCRCEDVEYAALQSQTSWTEAKLQTRCGMGPCQGRICGPAVETLFGWTPTSVRPPIFPIPVAAWCSSPAATTPQENP